MIPKPSTDGGVRAIRRLRDKPKQKAERCSSGMRPAFALTLCMDGHGVSGDTRPSWRAPASGNRLARPRQANAKGGFWYCTYEGGLTAELFVQLLRTMMRHRLRPIHLLIDGLPMHKTKLVKDYVLSTEGRLTSHFLPGYAPELAAPTSATSRPTNRSRSSNGKIAGQSTR